MLKKKSNIFLFLFILLLVGCSKRIKSEFRLYRFIDNLNSENIEGSPLLDMLEALVGPGDVPTQNHKGS